MNQREVIDCSCLEQQTMYQHQTMYQNVSRRNKSKSKNIRNKKNAPNVGGSICTTMSHGQEDSMTDIPATAQKTPPPHKPLPPGCHQQTNTHPCTTNLADFVGPIQHTLVNSVTNTNALIVIYTHQNTCLTIVNDNQGSPNAYHRSKKNLDPQPHSTGTMRAITKLKAMKMGISTEKIDHLTHMAPNLFLSLIPSYSLTFYLIPSFVPPFFTTDLSFPHINISQKSCLSSAPQNQSSTPTNTCYVASS